MFVLANKRVVLVVTGGIAAYKSADLVRQLSKAGAEVRVVMTSSAQALITPLTFQALSGYPVLVDWQQQESGYAMDHIALARWAEVIVIAPATADFIAKLAHGFADDIAATLCLAAAVPLVVAPAMNQQMWNNPATQANQALLQQRNIHFIGPAQGSQACGEEGFGRMEEPGNIVRALEDFFANSGVLQGKTVLITAGPTQEPIDPVRYISNHSTGKMGYALAEAAAGLGARVILVSGPTTLLAPKGVERISIMTAEEMAVAVMQRVAVADIFIAVAAVADYRPVAYSQQKLKKTGQAVQLVLEQNPDILSQVSALENRPFVVGFAAETENLSQQAQAKLTAKKLDLIAANLVATANGGFGSEENALLVLWDQGQKEFSLRSKKQLAQDLMQLIVQRYQESRQ